MIRDLPNVGGQHHSEAAAGIQATKTPVFRQLDLRLMSPLYVNDILAWGKELKQHSIVILMCHNIMTSEPLITAAEEIVLWPLRGTETRKKKL